MKNYSSIFNSKPDLLQSNSKSLSNSSVNYFQQLRLFKKLSQTTNEKQNLTHLSSNKSQENLLNEKSTLFKRPSINCMKKSIQPASMQNVYSNNNVSASFKQYNPNNTVNQVLKQKTNINQTKKVCHSRSSLNLTGNISLKPTFPTRNSINYSNMNNLSHCMTQKRFDQLHTFKSIDKSHFKKNIDEKENNVKFAHTRHTSSYANFSKPSTKAIIKMDSSTPGLQNSSRLLKTSIKQLQISDFQRDSHLEKLSFVESVDESRVNISVSSEQDIQQVEVTARFNFAQEKLPYFMKSLSETTTSLQNHLSKSNSKQITLSEFIVGPCKGKGRYGRVYLAIHKQTGWIFALKQISISVVNEMLPQLISQLKTQSFLDHPYITKIYGYFIDKESIYLIMQYMIDGSLYDLIKKTKPIPQHQVAIKLHQISQALSHIHGYHIIHRDLKPQNIVINFGVCKVCDFGWAVKCSNKRQTSCGTLDYLSPQMIQGTSYSSSIDLWAMGVLMYEMLVGKPPFYNISAKQTRKRIKQCEFTLPDTLSKQSKSLIQCFLRKNPGQRRQMDGILRHPFFQKVEE